MAASLGVREWVGDGLGAAPHNLPSSRVPGGSQTFCQDSGEPRSSPAYVRGPCQGTQDPGVSVLMKRRVVSSGGLKEHFTATPASSKHVPGFNCLQKLGVKITDPSRYFQTFPNI